MLIPISPVFLLWSFDISQTSVRSPYTSIRPSYEEMRCFGPALGKATFHYKLIMEMQIGIFMLVDLGIS